MKREGYTITDQANWYNFAHKKWSPRNGSTPIRIVPHHMAGNLTLSQFNAIMASSRSMSPTVAVFTDGTVCAYVPEECRPWTTGSWQCDGGTGGEDGGSLTLEIANDQIGNEWHISDEAYNKAVLIMAEWCKRYGIDPVYSYRGPGINMHKDWAATACPGPFMENKIKSGQLEKDIRTAMGQDAPDPEKKVLYRVQFGAFKAKTNADNYRQQIYQNGYECFTTFYDGYYRVQCGAFREKANAERMKATLAEAGYKTIIKVTEV